MEAKVLFVFCASALFIQSITAQCAGNTGSGIGALGLGLPNLNGNFFGNGNLYGSGSGLVPSSGGAFVVTSYSPITPSGVSVVSENAIDGSLVVTGALPFLGAIGMEGQVPAVGAAGVQYGCGNGNVGIVSENVVPAAGYTGLAGAGLAGPGLAGLGYGVPLANAGLAGPALNGPFARGPCANGNLY